MQEICCKLCIKKKKKVKGEKQRMRLSEGVKQFASQANLPHPVPLLQHPNNPRWETDLLKSV